MYGYDFPTIGYRFRTSIAVCRANESRDPQQYNRSNNRHYDTAKRANRKNSKQRKEPTTQKSADNTHQQIDPKTCSVAFYNHIGDPTCHQSYQKIPKKKNSHNAYLINSTLWRIVQKQCPYRTQYNKDGRYCTHTDRLLYRPTTFYLRKNANCTLP